MECNLRKASSMNSLEEHPDSKKERNINPNRAGIDRADSNFSESLKNAMELKGFFFTDKDKSKLQNCKTAAKRKCEVEETAGSSTDPSIPSQATISGPNLQYRSAFFSDSSSDDDDSRQVHAKIVVTADLHAENSSRSHGSLDAAHGYALEDASSQDRNLEASRSGYNVLSQSDNSLNTIVSCDSFNSQKEESTAPSEEYQSDLQTDCLINTSKKTCLERLELWCVLRFGSECTNSLKAWGAICFVLITFILIISSIAGVGSYYTTLSSITATEKRNHAEKPMPASIWNASSIIEDID